jgi:hypothetical protein
MRGGPQGADRQIDELRAEGSEALGIGDDGTEVGSGELQGLSLVRVAFLQRSADCFETVALEDDQTHQVERLEDDEGVAIAAVSSKVDQVLVHPPVARIGQVANLDPAPVAIDEVPTLLHPALRHLSAHRSQSDLLGELGQGVPVGRVAPEGHQELLASSAIRAEGSEQTGQITGGGSLRFGSAHAHWRGQYLPAAEPRSPTDPVDTPPDCAQSSRLMQDRYAGDVGDFMKFGLLRSLTAGERGLSLGVNWYLTGDESHNADGKHVTYLQTGTSHHVSLKNCDPELMARLGGVVATDRSVTALEASRVLPAGSVTYAVRLDDGLGDSGRHAWHSGAMAALETADVVFVDPDNGIRSVRRGAKPSKFAFLDELADYSARGQSLIVYHHADRSPGGVAVQVPRRLAEIESATEVEPLGAVVARRGSTRFFFIIPAAAHRQKLKTALRAHVARWTPHVEFVRHQAPAVGRDLGDRSA